METFEPLLYRLCNMTIKKYSEYNLVIDFGKTNLAQYTTVHENMAINASNIGDYVARSLQRRPHKCLMANFIDVLSSINIDINTLLLLVYLFSGEKPYEVLHALNILYNNTKN